MHEPSREKKAAIVALMLRRVQDQVLDENRTDLIEAGFNNGDFKWFMDNLAYGPGVIR